MDWTQENKSYMGVFIIIIVYDIILREFYWTKGKKCGENLLYNVWKHQLSIKYYWHISKRQKVIGESSGKENGILGDGDYEIFKI